ncbi:MAG: hypothetical protein ABSA42_16765 [Terracidiphilus sp.]|jgi:hypothetical protein
MGKINIGRVILGGIVAGIVADLLDYLVDGLWLNPLWEYDMGLLGHTSFSPNMWIGFDVLGIVGGIVAIWLYAAIRPRFGPGLKTAILAGVVVWVLGTLVPNASFMYVAALFSKHLTLYTTLGGLVEVVVGTIAGAALYKEA